MTGPHRFDPRCSECLKRLVEPILGFLIAAGTIAIVVACRHG